jgi:hypothetical protein
MDKKKITLWGIVLLIGLMLTGCAAYDAGYFDYPYYYHDYDHGYPYYGDHHEFREHHDGGEHHGFGKHHEGGECHHDRD